jgi:hypothetical protein
LTSRAAAGSGAGRPPARGWPGAGRQDPGDGGVLGRGDPQVIAELDRHLYRREGAAEGPVRREPGGRIGVALALVDRSGHGQQVERVVGHIGPGGHAQPAGPGLPGVGEGHDMVDLNGPAGVLPPGEEHDGLGVRVVQHSPGHDAAARAGLDHDAGEVPAQNVVTGITPVVAPASRNVVCPGLTEPGPAIAGQCRAASNWQGRQACKGFGCWRPGHRRRRWCRRCHRGRRGACASPAAGDAAGEDEDSQSGPARGLLSWPKRPEPPAASPAVTMRR